MTFDYLKGFLTGFIICFCIFAVICAIHLIIKVLHWKVSNKGKQEETHKETQMDKVLEALERLKTAPTFMGGTPEYQACTKSETLLMQDYETVKQFILKAQEPKQYLKWEDLKFEHTPKMFDVKMNDNKYRLVVGYNVAGYNAAGNNMVILRNDKQQYYFLEADKQLFNDLRLERIRVSRNESTSLDSYNCWNNSNYNCNNYRY